MDRDFLKSQLERLEMAYDKFPHFDTPKVDLWLECFNECDEETFSHAVMSYMKTNEFPPTIAGIYKCYREIDEYRQMMKALIKGQYNIMRLTWEEPFSVDCYNKYLEIVCKAPKGVREDLATEITQKAVQFYHDCEYDGKEPPALIDYLEGLI